MARLIDTSVFIHLERAGRPLGDIVNSALSERYAIASITASELLSGVERANTPSRRSIRSAFVEAVLTEIPMLPLDVAVARMHARLWANLESTGNRIGPYDMLIAATALAKGYDLITLNVEEFQRVPRLVVSKPLWER